MANRPIAEDPSSDESIDVEATAPVREARKRAHTLPPPLPPLSLPPPRPERRAARARVPREGGVVADKYIVVRSLGKSGLGGSLLVRHQELGQHFVFRYLPEEACAYPDTVARFLRGARGALKLTSEHAARTIDAGRLDSGIPYVVTEFLEGQTLADILESERGLPSSEAVDLVLQAAEAVAEAHRHGLVHGGLNPATLFIAEAPDGSPLVKVTDFGVGAALHADPLSSDDVRRTLETLSCTAPEQVRRSGDVDPRSDIWALGALLYEALTGGPVYAAESVAGLLAMIVADPPPALTSQRPDAPASLERVVLRCLEKERNARYASVAELAVALKPFAPPESQALADRITRTLGRAGRTSRAPDSSRALVHVPAPPPSAAAPSSNRRSPLERHQLLLAATLIAFGMFGGPIVATLVTRNSAPPTVTVIERPIDRADASLAYSMPSAVALPNTTALAMPPAPTAPAPVPAPAAPRAPIAVATAPRAPAPVAAPVFRKAAAPVFPDTWTADAPTPKVEPKRARSASSLFDEE